MSNPVGPTPAPEGGNTPASDPNAAVSDAKAAAVDPKAAVSGPKAGSAAPKKKKSKAVWIILAVVAVLVLVLVVVGGVVVGMFADPTKDAKAGDCLASEAAKDVKVGERGVAKMTMVDCASRDAAFVVLGRVDGVTDVNNGACEKYVKEGEQYLAVAGESGDGYLLCLKPKS
ncbi:hypothetical protein EV385_3955 [Krasilnikovia cinnamomea]|uniref:Uncharacterized protein n=1 Tax=Krasilnikovia cinnamomea TaxID=349313 RepID=A0A4Q7ZN80_9ACTN|nr:hypothetical protein [Krasilnikovia cinnamomea]RZU52114.1 hypothetical protein EV385_3955 [Krasilnikovia cinnamomea]